MGVRDRPKRWVPFRSIRRRSTGRLGILPFFDLQTQFPTGDYTFNLTGGAFGLASVMINYTGDAYSNTLELTANSFTGLPGLKAADPYSVSFNETVVNSKANASFISFPVERCWPGKLGGCYNAVLRHLNDLVVFHRWRGS